MVVIAGPNGSGKTTLAPALLRDFLGVREFVNADTIALGLSGFEAEGSAIAAGRILLRRIEELARLGVDFSFETTLASRSLARWLGGLRERGYRVCLVFLWLESPELAIARVEGRVRLGGHGVPEETIRRRYRRGLSNFVSLYRPLSDRCVLYDNSSISGVRPIAKGRLGRRDVMEDSQPGNGCRRRRSRPRVSGEVSQRFGEHALLLKVLQRAVRKALSIHKRLGNPVAAWQGGRVVWIPADQIPVPDSSPG